MHHHQGAAGGFAVPADPSVIGGYNPMASSNNNQYDQEREIELRKRLAEVQQKYGIKQVDVARETNVNHSSLSLWVRGKHEGNQTKMSDAIEAYLDSFENAKPRINSMHISKLNSLKQPNNRLLDNSLFDQPETQFGALIPMKVELDLEGGQRLKELFLWDRDEPYMTIESFARILIEEHGLNQQAHEADVCAQMRRQIKDFRGYKIMTDQVPLSFIEQQQQMKGGEHLIGNGSGGRNTAQHMGPGHKMVSLPLEQIRTISVNVRIGRVVYKDKFEWDINNPDNSPEDFAECVCADLGLGDEFALAIAHQIREKVLELQKQANSERRTKIQQTSEAERMDKLEGSYAQIRSSTFPHAFNSANIGLPIEQFRDENGYPMRTKEGITSTCEQLRNEQYFYDPMAANELGAGGGGTGQPLRTMIRSLDTLAAATNGHGRNQFKTTVGLLADAGKDTAQGWSPEVEILSEQDLKRIEKQEDRESRMRKRRTR